MTCIYDINSTEKVWELEIRLELKEHFMGMIIHFIFSINFRQHRRFIGKIMKPNVAFDQNCTYLPSC